MSDYNGFSPEMKSYYDSLPSYVKECIAKSDRKFDTLGELRTFADGVKLDKKNGGCGC